MQITISGQGGSGTIVATDADTKKYTTTKVGLRKNNIDKKVSSWVNLKDILSFTLLIMRKSLRNGTGLQDGISPDQHAAGAGEAGHGC